MMSGSDESRRGGRNRSEPLCFAREQDVSEGSNSVRISSLVGGGDYAKAKIYRTERRHCRGETIRSLRLQG